MINKLFKGSFRRNTVTRVRKSMWLMEISWSQWIWWTNGTAFDAMHLTEAAGSKHVWKRACRKRRCRKKQKMVICEISSSLDISLCCLASGDRDVISRIYNNHARPAILSVERLQQYPLRRIRLHCVKQTRNATDSVYTATEMDRRCIAYNENYQLMLTIRMNCKQNEEMTEINWWICPLSPWKLQLSKCGPPPGRLRHLAIVEILFLCANKAPWRNQGLSLAPSYRHCAQSPELIRKISWSIRRRSVSSERP
jgi:hypothetical protein